MLVDTGLLHSEANQSHPADSRADGANRRLNRRQIRCRVLATRVLWP
jgi:hypothetical protein